MAKKPKHTMSELLAAIATVGKDPSHQRYQSHFMEIAYIIANHVQLMNDIKTFREYMHRHKPKDGETVPMMVDVLKTTRAPAGVSGLNNG